jgi:hypothetical protein
MADNLCAHQQMPMLNYDISGASGDPVHLRHFDQAYRMPQWLRSVLARGTAARTVS